MCMWPSVTGETTSQRAPTCKIIHGFKGGLRVKLRQLLSLSRVADGAREFVHCAHSAEAQSDKSRRLFWRGTLVGVRDFSWGDADVACARVWRGVGMVTASIDEPTKRFFASDGVKDLLDKDISLYRASSHA